MIYGYARVSTKLQAKDGNSIEAQKKELQAAGCSVIYTDAYIGTKTHRPELDKLLLQLQDGDMTIVRFFFSSLLPPPKRDTVGSMTSISIPVVFITSSWNELETKRYVSTGFNFSSVIIPSRSVFHC